MVLTITLNKGKKRAIDSLSREVPLEPVGSSSEPPHPTKRIKRAETRQCPICNEHIPLRLLAKHAELESARVEDIIHKVGSMEVLLDDLTDNEPGPSSKARRSAIRARRSITTTRHVVNTMEQTSKTIEKVKRRRKKRHTKLKEMLKEEDEGKQTRYSWFRRFNGEEIICPVCSSAVRGDRDVLDAHVDSCLSHEGQRLEDARQQELLQQQVMEEVEIWDDADDTGNYVGNIRGAGFHTFNGDEGVDDEIDIDGDDQAIFGEAQFDESDVVPVNRNQEIEDVQVDVEDENDEAWTLRELIGAGKKSTTIQDMNTSSHQKSALSDMDRVEAAITVARQRNDKTALLFALENKLKLVETSTAFSSGALSCRICLDIYIEPTVSTGCWHTCCKECWLRCLGSTKLCPICKRITGTSDLRRVYL